MNKSPINYILNCEHMLKESKTICDSCNDG